MISIFLSLPLPLPLYLSLFHSLSFLSLPSSPQLSFYGSSFFSLSLSLSLSILLSLSMSHSLNSCRSSNHNTQSLVKLHVVKKWLRFFDFLFPLIFEDVIRRPPFLAPHPPPLPPSIVIPDGNDTKYDFLLSSSVLSIRGWGRGLKSSDKHSQFTTVFLNRWAVTTFNEYSFLSFIG